MLLKKELKIYKRFIFTICLTVTLALSSIFLGFNLKTRQLIHEENLIQARSLFNSVVIARKWNARYNGVYVKKTPGVISNPFLKRPDIYDSEGNPYTLRNPAIMTHEISVIADQEGQFRFHMTSLKPLNPKNKPDPFEREALQKFELGEREFMRTELMDGRQFFRYIAPLHVEQSCLSCHADEGYRLGEVRGGISVSFDVENTRDKLVRNLIMIIVFGALTTGSLVGLLYYFTKRFIRKVSDARKQIERLATIDGLTEVNNRRYGMERFEEELTRFRRNEKGLVCMMVDIDHFKLVNDRFGHQVGDDVLKEVAARISKDLRPYDMLFRYGGEEFMVVLPDTELTDAVSIGERIWMSIRKQPVGDCFVTASIGVTAVRKDDPDLHEIINRADEALYHAKNEGRDRVEVRY